MATASSLTLLQFKRSLLLFIVCLVGASNGQSKLCHRSTSKPGLHFTDKNGPATLVIGCDLEWVDIICCTSNFREIVWYQAIDNKTWREFMLINNETRRTSEDHQVATIKRLQRQTDSGSFRCVAHGDNGETIENVAVMDIRNCSFWSDPPIPLNPRSNLTSFPAFQREIAIITCSSFSGVDCDETVCVYGWYKRHSPFDDSDFDQIPEANSSIRVRIINSFSREGLRMESILIIANVTTEDYNGAFVCYAVNNIGSTYKRVVRLYAPSPDIKIPVGVAAAGVTLLFICAILLLVRADLDVKIWWTRRQIMRLPQDDTDYDVALLFSESERFALYLRQTLQRDFHLKVFSVDDLHPGTAPISCLPEGAKKSRSVLVVMTPEVYDDKDFLTILSEIISDANPVFVLYRLDSAETDPPRLNRNITGAMRVRPPLRWPGRVCEMGEVSSTGPDYLEDEQEVKYWKGSGSRQVRIFWKELRLSLLKMEKARVVLTGNVRTDSWSGPLLTGQSDQ